MKNNSVKLTELAKKAMDAHLMQTIYACAPECENTCDCTCSCDLGNTIQSNSNLNVARTNSRDKFC